MFHFGTVMSIQTENDRSQLLKIKWDGGMVTVFPAAAVCKVTWGYREVDKKGRSGQMEIFYFCYHSIFAINCVKL